MHACAVPFRAAGKLYRGVPGVTRYKAPVSNSVAFDARLEGYEKTDHYGPADDRKT